MNPSYSQGWLFLQHILAHPDWIQEGFSAKVKKGFKVNEEIYKITVFTMNTLFLRKNSSIGKEFKNSKALTTGYIKKWSGIYTQS